MNEHMDATPLGESFNDVGLVHRHAAPQVAGYTDVERTVSPVREEVDTRLHCSWITARSMWPLDPRFRGGDELSVRVFAIANGADGTYRRILNDG